MHCGRPLNEIVRRSERRASMIDPTPYLAVLQSFGISVSASAFVEFLKARFAGGRVPSVAEFENELGGFLKIHGATINAATVINALATRGLLSIQGSALYAHQQITMGAGPGAQFQFGNNSSSHTANTGIVAGAGAQIVGSNAAIVQNPDGSISFHVGSDEKK